MIDDIEDDEDIRSVTIEYGRGHGDDDDAAAMLASLIESTPGILEFVAAECIFGSLRDSRVDPIALGRDAAAWTSAAKVCGAWESPEHQGRSEEFASIVGRSGAKTVRDGIAAAIASIVTGISVRTIGIGGELRARIPSFGESAGISDAGALEHSAVVCAEGSSRQAKLAAITAARFEGLYYIPDMEGWIWSHDGPGSAKKIRAMLFALPAHLSTVRPAPGVSESKKMECIAGALEASFERNAFLSKVLAESGISIGGRVPEDASDRFAESLRKLLDAVCAAIDEAFAEMPKSDRKTRDLAASAMEDLSELGAISRYVRRYPGSSGLRSMLSDVAIGGCKADAKALMSSTSRVVSSAIREAARLDARSGRNAILTKASDLGTRVSNMISDVDGEISRRRRRLRTLASVARNSMF